MIGALRGLLSRLGRPSRRTNEAIVAAGTRVSRPVFITGCGRSGTAFLFELLKPYPELVATTGHPDGEDHVGWMEHGGAVIAGLATPQGDSGHVGYHFCPHMDETDVSEGVREGMHSYYASNVLRGDLSGRVLNKCPHLCNKLRYVRAIFPDARFIHIVREPVAMVASWVKLMQAVPELMLYWPETRYPCFWVIPAKDAAKRGHVLAREPRFYPGGGPLMLADYWSEVNANIAPQLSDAPEQLLTVRYEDVITRPEEEMERIARFCDIRVPPTHRPEIKSGRNMAYRELLTDKDVSAIRDRTARIAQQFGYGGTGELS